MGNDHMNYVIVVILLIVLAVLLLGVWLRIKYVHEQKEIKRAGKRGELLFEDMVEDILQDGDVLLNNVSLSVDGKQTEIDNLIINRNGIFIVEIKNYNGILYGDADDYEWVKKKISPGGNVYTKKVRNPIKQTKRQIYILSEYLKYNGIKIWIKGYAYFINQNSPVDDECVIDDISRLDSIIHNQDKLYDKKLINKAIRLLS